MRMTRCLVQTVSTALVLSTVVARSGWADVGVNLGFSPNTATVSQPSALTITLLNPNLTAATATGFTNSLPTSLRVANPANVSNSSGGTVTAVAGTGTSIALAGGTIPASVGGAAGSCTITVNVVTNTPNTYLNTISAGALSSSNGTNTQQTQATLTVGAVVPVSGSITFSNASLHGNAAPTRLTITLQNPNTVALTNNAFVLSIPSVINLASTPNYATTCTGGASVTGTAGNPALLNFTGGTIPANGPCTITADIIARDPLTRGTSTNVTLSIPAGSLTNAQGGSSEAITGAVRVETGGFVSAKAFGPSTVTTGGNTVLTYTLVNYNATPINGVTFSDTLPQPGGGSLLIVNPPVPTNTCGGNLIATNGGSSFSYGTVTPGVIPAFPSGAVGGTTCTVAVTLQAIIAGTSAITIQAPFPGANWSGIDISAVNSGPLTITPPAVITASVLSIEVSLAMPKSRILISSVPSRSLATSTLLGFRSRCTTPCACASSRPDNIWVTRPMVRSTGTGDSSRSTSLSDEALLPEQTTVTPALWPVSFPRGGLFVEGRGCAPRRIP